VTLELPRPAERSWWLEEALALPEFAGPEAPALRGNTTADVVIVGGGYTGMWSAWFLKERQPDIDVVLLEADICGGGPSGRNGGFVNGLYEELGILVERFGDEGRRACELAARSIDEVGAWCATNGVDAEYTKVDHLVVSTSPDQDQTMAEVLEEAEALGIGDVHRALPDTEVRSRFGSPVVRHGYAVTHAALVHPARLARGLRRALIERGVRIHERTHVVRLDARTATAETPSGTVRAGRAVLGLNAWAATRPEFRRDLMIRETSMLISAPAPLEDINWTGGEGVYDLRTALHYPRPTRDGRIAFGGTSLLTAARRADDPRYRFDAGSVAKLVRDFRRWFPQFDAMPLEAAWSGPIDVSGLHFPFFGTLPGGRAHYALGFTGNGVGPCHLGGKILSGLAIDVQDEATTLPLVDAERKRFPPEPLFTLGERLVSAAMRRRDRRLDAGRSPGWLTDALAHLPRTLGFNLGP